jgi:[acyl-carrier-protein] S-malonyltransferase
VLFPGQGLALATCAAEWRSASTVVSELLDVAAEAVKVPMARLLHGSGVALRRTECYQPVLTALCAGVLAEFETRHGVASYTLGHSLGELPACVAAGVFSPRDAVTVAAARGALMAREAQRHPGGVVVLRATRAEAETIVARASAYGTIVIAAFNALDQHVVSGDHAALRAVPVSAHPLPLDGGGAWHSPAMRGAEEEFARVVQAHARAPSRARWIANAHASVVMDGAAVVPTLTGQLTRPVQWMRSLEALRVEGVRTVVTVGPTRSMRTLAARTLGDWVRLVPMEHPNDLNVSFTEVSA